MIRLDAGLWEERLAAAAARHAAAGASLAISLGSESVNACAGTAGPHTDASATPSTLFEIGSVTKVWTATLALQLAEKERLALEAPVSRYLPGFTTLDAAAAYPSAPRMTVAQLLCHASGLDGDVILDTGDGADALERYADAIGERNLLYPPGTFMSYANAGYSVLGRIIEIVTDSAWEEALRRQVLAPLGIDRDVRSDQAPPAAHTPKLPRSAGPAGALHATASDVVAFVRMHLADGMTAQGQRLLAASTARRMREAVVTVPDGYRGASHWGLGWMLSRWLAGGEPLEVCGHDGATPGYAAIVRAAPAADFAFCLLMRGGDAAAMGDELLAYAARNLLNAELSPPPEPRLRAPAPPVDRYTGRYETAGVEIEVTPSEDGELALSARPTDAISVSLGYNKPVVHKLQPTGDDSFIAHRAGSKEGIPVVFSSWPFGRYVHMRARAARRSTTGPI